MSFISKWKQAFEEETSAAALKETISQLQERLYIYENIKYNTKEIPEYHFSKNEAIAVAMLSDVHLEERVDPEDVPGTYNIYNPNICEKRLHQFAQKVCALSDAQRHLADIQTLCLFLGGDIISGYIHEDLAETNWLPPIKAISKAVTYCSSVISYLLEHGNFKKIIIPCCYGNHGRMLKEIRNKNAAGVSLEWMLYNFLSNYVFKNEKRLVWHVADSAMVYVKLGNFICRFTHGDKVRFKGGVGGIYVPIQKMVKNWNMVLKADYTFMGHFHTASDFGNILVNGSVIGPNAYSLESGFFAERPKQLYILINQKRGKSLVADIWCDYVPNATKSKKEE